ncbi:MAG TPA: tRNA-uridine aminocarboxypropyltransferase [Chitinispirillaceae bacterium]|nr:tRNA-uridine aminocarboxypropyltransferase [Chitinispirillaceae bacterium]
MQEPLLSRNDSRVHTKVAKERACPECRRDTPHCLCGKVTSFSNRIKVIILQHPQEQFKISNSAALAHLMLRNSTLLTGLSWKSFKTVAGESELPSQWGILHLKGHSNGDKPVEIFERNGSSMEKSFQLRGIIAIDGSWKQAKALWWRNSWMLKLHRVALNPDFQSVRNQSKEEGLSTIEAIAFTLKNLGEKPVIADSLVYQYRKLIEGTCSTNATLSDSEESQSSLE